MSADPRFFRSLCLQGAVQLSVLNQAVIFFLLMLVGIYARRTSLITPENQQKLSGIVVNIAYPAIILSGALAEGERIEGTALLEATAAAFATLALAAAGGVLISRLLRIEARMRGVFVVMTIFTNIGFMGVPMVRGIYGADALIYLTVFLIPVNLFFFSYAVAAIRGDKLTLGEGRFLAVLRQLCNNGMIACVLAILFYFVDLPVPAPIRGTVEMLGSMTAPLAMLLMGSFLVDVNWIEGLRDLRSIVYCVLKMIVLPVVAVRLMGLFTENAVLLGVYMAALATPCGNVIALLTAMYNREAYPSSVKTIAVTTILSVVTMPIAFRLAGLG